MYLAKMPWDYIEEKKYSANLCLKDVWPRCLETILTILKEEKYSAMMPEIILKRKYSAKLCLEHIREKSITVRID